MESTSLTGRFGSRLRESTRMASALRYPQYRRYWLGNLAAVSGQQMMWIAQGWLIYQLTGSPLYLGYAGLVSAAPAILLNLVGGVLADRLDQRKVIIWTQLFTGALVCTLATLTALAVVQPWHILAVAFFTGATQAFNNPARQAIFPQLIDRKDLMNAVSLNSMVWQGTRIVAPATGGIIVATAGTAATLYLCSFGFLALAVAVSGMKTRRQPREHRESVLRDLGEGLGFIRDNFIFAFLIGMTFFNSFFGNSALQLMPVFARDVLDVGPSGLGFLFSASGIGSLLGVFIVGNLGDFERKGLLLLGGATASGSFLVLFAVSSFYPLSLVALFFMGMFSSIYMISVQTTLQMQVPDALRGRVMGVYGMTYNLGPLGAIQAGVVAHALSAQSAVALGGLAVIVFTLAVAISNSQVRRLQRESAG